MSTMTTTSPPAIEPVGLSRAEARALMEHQNDEFLTLLRSLSDEEWAAPTDCAPWTPKDIAAHVLGWAVAFPSIKELGRLYRTGFKHRKEMGNLTDAVNEVQVRDRRHVPPSKIVEELEVQLPRFTAFRRKIGGPAHYVPLYDPGILGRATFGYLLNTIFTRDVFMHRIDIARAANKELVLGPREQRLIEDVVVDWGRRRGADATVRLTGPAGGSYRLGSGSRAAIEGDAIAFVRVLAGRGRISDLALTGDVPAAESWLSKGCPF